MHREKILIVDDDPVIVKIVSVVLHALGRSTDATGSGKSAIALVKREKYDMMLLDLVLEDSDGINVLRSVRQTDPDLPVIVLTAHGSLDSAIEALRLGANDYLVKPLQPADLKPLFEQFLCRRAHTESAATPAATPAKGTKGQPSKSPVERDRYLERGSLMIDQYRRCAYIQDRPLALTTAEYDILWALARQAPHPLTPNQLLKQALGYETSIKEASEIIKWHIHQLRKKIEHDPKEPVLIKTIRYVGYAWVG